MLHVLSVFTLCHVRAKNLPRLSIYGYRFVFSLQGCARFWLQARELDDFLFFEAIRGDNTVPLPLHVMSPIVFVANKFD